MTRQQVLIQRAIPSLVALGLLLVVVFGYWFPGKHAWLAGIGGRVAILVAASLLIGPCMTALVYRRGKRRLRSDIAVLAVLELTIVGAMAWLLYERRPAYTVFAVDRFEVVTAREIDASLIGYDRLRRRPGHTPRLVYAELPTDPEVFDRLLDETVFYGLPDIDRRPQHWKPYSAGIGQLRQRAKSLAEAAASDDDRGRAARRWLGDRSADDFLLLPVRGRKRDGTMIVHARTGYPVDILAVDPW